MVVILLLFLLDLDKYLPNAIVIFSHFLYDIVWNSQIQISYGSYFF